MPPSIHPRCEDSKAEAPRVDHAATSSFAVTDATGLVHGSASASGIAGHCSAARLLPLLALLLPPTLIFLLYHSRAPGAVALILWPLRQHGEQVLPPRPAAPAHAPPFRIALLGDSITRGAVCPPGDGAYGEQLALLLGPANYTVASFSADGTWATRADPGTGVPFPPIGPLASASPITVHPAWPAALAYAADVYVVLLGVNDAFRPWYSEDAFVASYVDIVHALQALPTAPLVAVCTSPPLVLFEASPNPQGALRLPALQRGIAAATGALLIDVHGAFGGSDIPAGRESLCDGVHPTRAGAGIIARAVASGLQEALLEGAGWPAFKQCCGGAAAAAGVRTLS